MSAQTLFAFLLTAPLLLSAAPPGGITPRSNASGYAAHADGPGFSVGLSALSSSQARHAFGGEIGTSRFLVFEAGVFPEAGKQISVAPQSFSLRTGGKSVSAVDAEDVMPAGKSQTLPLVPSESRPGGGYRVSSGTSLADYARVLFLALEAKELPDAKTKSPIAGYLYFPKPKSMPRKEPVEIVYSSPSGPVTLRIPTQ